MKEPYSAGAAAVGLRLRQQRLKRGWSQEGLCRDICAASYLSKIEQGQVQAAPELLELLFRRLELPWYGESLPELERLVEHRYECLLDGDKEGFRDSRETFRQALDRLLSSPLAADGLVLDAMDRNDPTEIPPALEPYLDRRQLAILRVVQNRDMEAVRLLPEAYCYLMAVTNGVASGYSPILVAFFRTFPGMTAAMYSLFSVAEFLGRTVGGFVQYRMEIPEKKRYGFAFLVYMVYEAMDMLLLWLPYPLMLASRGLCGFLGTNSATMRQAAVQRYIPDRLRARVNAFESMLYTGAAAVLSLVIGALGEVLDYRLCVTLCGGFTMVVCLATIWRGRKYVRAVYERSGE